LQLIQLFVGHLLVPDVRAAVSASETFADGIALLHAAEEHRLEGVVSKRRDAPYRSGDCRDWRKVKTAAWREANKERWRLFEQR
jgi:ATP-dependent DNA ligase